MAENKMSLIKIQTLLGPMASWDDAMAMARALNASQAWTNAHEAIAKAQDRGDHDAMIAAMDARDRAWANALDDVWAAS